MKKKFGALVNLSGGLDSTYCAWKWMKENPSKTLLIHHCLIHKIKERIPRHDFEHEAYKRVLQSFRSLGLNNFEAFESEFKIDLGARSRLNDQILVGFMAMAHITDSGLLVKDYIISVSKEDIQMHGHTSSGQLRRQRLQEMRKVFRKDLNYLYPIKNMMREEMINALPKEILKEIYFCQGLNAKTSEPCGECDTCRCTVGLLTKRGI